MKEKLPLRKDVPIEQTWNLLDIFKTEAMYNEALGTFQSLAKDFKERYENKIQSIRSKDDLNECLNKYNEVLTHYIRLRGYAYLDVNVDMTSAKAQNRLGTLSLIGSQVLSSLSFFESELILLPDEFLKEVAKSSEYRVFLNDQIKQKPYQLQPQTEMALKALNPVLELPYDGYEVTKLSDMDFHDFEVNGVKYPNSFVQYENSYQYEVDNEVRREAFKSFYKDLKTYENTIANYYNTQVKKEKILSSLRGFESVFDYLLLNQDVSIDLYNRQIDVIMDELSVHMRRYAKKLEKKLGVDKIHWSDLQTPYMSDQAKKVTYEENRNLSIESLGVLGEKYQSVVKRLFDERWIDWSSNVGKSTGGFCLSINGVHPYILLSWNNNLADVYTTVHEIGHAVQSVFSEERHPKFLQTKTNLYTIEAPSTFNEMLLTNYLLENSEDPHIKEWAAATMIGNTYYHNFVTHFMEAAFQREVYKLVDKGVDLQAEDFSRIFREQLEKFWGDSVIIDEGAELTWMRQPHYYRGLYSYTYSAGLTISTVMSQRVIHGGPQEVQQWNNAIADVVVLEPIEFAASLDIDITTDKPLKETITYIGSLVDQLK